MTIHKGTEDAPLEGQNAPVPTADDDSSSAPGSSRELEGSSTNESDSNSRSGTAHTGSTHDDINAIKEELTHEETKQVFRLRILVLLSMMATAIAISYTIFRITREAEIEEFENEFIIVANLIIVALNGTYWSMVLRIGVWFSLVVASRGMFPVFLSSNSIADHDLTFLRFQTSSGIWLLWPASP
jgi:hypothetical protein